MSKSNFMISLLAATVASLPLLPGTAVASDPLERVGTLHVPGQPLAVFDIGYVNQDGIYALADRSNGGVDFFDTATDKYLGRAGGFTGFSKASGTKVAGPNGVVAVGAHEFRASDGDSSVNVIDARAMKVIDNIPTNGKSRTDEIAYDMRSHHYYLAAVANKGGPALGVMDSLTNRVVAAIPTGPRAHSVAVDAKTNKVFVPIQASPSMYSGMHRSVRS